MLGLENPASRTGKGTLAMKKALQVIAGIIAGLAVVFWSGYCSANLQ